MTSTISPSGFGRRVSRFLLQPHQHGVAGRGVAGVLGGDEDILRAIGAGRAAGRPHEAEARLGAAKDAGDAIAAVAAAVGLAASRPDGWPRSRACPRLTSCLIARFSSRRFVFVELELLGDARAA